MPDDALAAGVGVPPDGSEPFVAQSAKSADVRGLRAKIRAHVERLLPHGDDCDEGWTQGVCGRCDLLAAMEVSFGFALPLGADAVDRVIEAACALRFTDWRSEVRAAEVNTELWHDLVDAVDALTASEASAAEGRKPKPDAGVGVARPAEPPKAVEMPIAMRNPAVYWRTKDSASAPAEEQPDARADALYFTNSRGQSGGEALPPWQGETPSDALEADLARAERSKLALAQMFHDERAEVGRLREQLDAQTETLRLRSEAWHAQSKNLMDAWGQVSALTGALEAADDLLRRLSEWDALNLLPVEAPYGDAPYWQREIAKTRAAVVAALPKEPDGSRAALGDVAAAPDQATDSVSAPAKGAGRAGDKEA